MHGLNAEIRPQAGTASSDLSRTCSSFSLRLLVNPSSSNVIDLSNGVFFRASTLSHRKFGFLSSSRIWQPTAELPARLCWLHDELVAANDREWKRGNGLSESRLNRLVSKKMFSTRRATGYHCSNTFNFIKRPKQVPALTPFVVKSNQEPADIFEHPCPDVSQTNFLHDGSSSRRYSGHGYVRYTSWHSADEHPIAIHGRRRG